MIFNNYYINCETSRPLHDVRPFHVRQLEEARRTPNILDVSSFSVIGWEQTLQLGATANFVRTHCVEDQ